MSGDCFETCQGHPEPVHPILGRPLQSAPAEPPEGLREQIVQTIAASSFVLIPDFEGGHYGTSAPPEDVADALLAGPLAPLIELTEWLVSLDDDDPESPGRVARRTVTLTAIIERARKAL